MSRRRRRHDWKLRVSFRVVEAVADALLDGPTRVMTEGFSLQASSGLWRKKDGTLTARLVYRAASTTARIDSLVVTIRNISIEHDAATEAAASV